MEMLHGLSCRRTHVEAHVEAVGAQLLVELPLYRVNECEYREFLCAGGQEPVCNHTARDDEVVPG